MSENTPNPKDNTADIDRACQLLLQLSEMANHSTLVGTLPNGGRAAARQYNNMLRFLQREGAVPPDLFPELPEETASMDDVGVMAQQVALWAKRTRTQPGGFNFNLTGGPNIDLGADLKDLGATIRAHLPDWMRGEAPPPWGPTPPTPPTPPVSPVPPVAPAPPVGPATSATYSAKSAVTVRLTPDAGSQDETAQTLAQVQAEMARVSAQMGAVAQQMGSPDLSAEGRAGLAQELTRLSQEQSRLGQDMADLAQRHANAL
jgi:hypothetical protein